MSTPTPTWRVRWQRSLGLKLVALFVVLAVAMSLVFSFGMQRAFGEGWRGAIRPLVRDYIDRLAAEIGSPPSLERAQALTQRLPITLRIEGPQVQWQSGPDLDELPPLPPPRHLGPEHRHHRAYGMGAAGDALEHQNPPEARTWMVRQTADGHTLTFGLDVRSFVRQPQMVGWITLAVLLVLTGLAYALVRRLFKPLGDIAAGVSRYGQGDFSQPIPVRRADELGELAQRVNHMATDLSGMLDAKRALLLAISHELRSPLTRARLNAELVEEGASRDALLRDLGEMRDLITDLLESERLAQRHQALNLEPIHWPGLLQQAVQTCAMPDTVHLSLSGEAPAAWQGDRTRLALLLRNLIDNALRHGAGAPVEVHAAWSAQALTVTVRDHGPGVTPEQLAHLAEPFYRTDAARGRSTGGVGLGLHLCRLVAEAHGGTLGFAQAEPGLKAIVTLPLTETAGRASA